MAKKPNVDVLFVKSKVREYIKSKECNTSGDVIDGPALNDALIDILDNKNLLFISIHKVKFFYLI